MFRKAATSLFFALAFQSSAALAADLPELLAGQRNAVPECVTPGRLMAFLKLRNAQLDPRYDRIASEYMAQGELLGLRWDYAFYQMVVETGALSYWRGHRSGDVKPSQNNFAGLGATGRGVRGESFTDIPTGVRAHLEHLMLYAGKPVEDPVADRTRKVREWGVLTSWHQGFTRPITYTDLGAKWAPGTKAYGALLRAVADHFHANLCAAPDPRPDLVQEARAVSGKAMAAARAADATPSRPSEAEVVQRAVEQAKADGLYGRSALGAQPPREPGPPSAPFKVLNPPPSAPEIAGHTVKIGVADALPAPKSAPKASTDKSAPRTALAPALSAAKLAPAVEAATPPGTRCRVWTASYGGQKAIIIRSLVDQMVNFTVLDVHEGSEEREAEAFIAAYAKNGKVAGEYPNQSQALEKAFELCPEG
jgi:hypothetical protein